MDTDNKIKTDETQPDYNQEKDNSQDVNNFSNKQVSNYQSASSIPSQKQTMTTEDMGILNNTIDNNFENGQDNGNVIVSPAQNRIPLWFIMVFVFTIILFIIITVLLIMRIQKDKNISGVKKPIANISQMVKPTEMLQPTIILSPTEAVDKETDSLMNISSGESLELVENDLNNTKFDILDTFLKDENALEFITPSKP